MVSLKNFQKKCADNKRIHDEIELDRLRLRECEEHANMCADRKRMAEWNILIDAQEKFGNDYKPKLELSISTLSLMGLKKEKCPCCDDRLEKNIIKEDESCEYHIMYCKNCGYRFARVIGI